MIRTVHPSLVQIAVFALGVLLVSGACTSTVGPLGTPSTPAPTADASVGIPSGDATPGTPSPTDTSAPSGPTASATPPGGASEAPSAASPAATPNAAPSATGTIILRVYFLYQDYMGQRLVPVLREVPRTQAVAAAAMRALLAGPSAKEKAATPPLYTEVRTGTRLLGITIEGGIATVDLSGEFAYGGTAPTADGRLAQVVYTLTQFPSVTGVLFEMDGEPLSSMGSIPLIRASGRADLNLMPPIFVDHPAWGAAAGNPIEISGLANVFEAQFRAQVRDATGAVVADRQVTATCGTGCWGDFSSSIPYTVAKAQWGVLRVYDLSAQDGSPENVTEYPVWLTPAG